MSGSRKQILFFIATFLFLGMHLGSTVVLKDTRVYEQKQQQDPFGEEAGVPGEYLASYLLGTVAGGLNHAMISYLWVQYEQLKREERFDEAVSLLDALVILQPDRERVWTHLGWDIAYNISWRQTNENEEWQSVQEGIRRLEEGLERMPESLDLRLWLARIYHHRIPQNRSFMDRVWNQSHQENSYETNYSIARDIIMEGREYAHEKDEETLGWYQNRYVHAINSDFNHIVNLMRYGEHERALDAIDPARERIVTLYDEERGNKPITVEQRQQSYSMLDEIIQKDREVVQISRENREEKIQKTIELLELWKTFFRDYPVTNGTHAGRFSMGRFFELLYYVDSDLRAYYFQGNEQARERAQNLIGNRLQPVLQNLTDPEHMTTDGIAREAGADLGRFWDVMTSYYENMSNYVQIMNERDRNQNREQQEQLQQEQIEIERNLEDQFVRLSEMYHAPHRAFKEPFHHKQTGEDWWFDQRLEQIRSLLNLGTR